MRRWPWTGAAIAALCASLGTGSCLPGDLTDPRGQEVTLLVRANVSAAGAATVVVEVTASDIPTTLVFNIPVVNGVASGPITLPAGSGRTLTVHAFDTGGVETHRGSVTVDIHAGTNPSIALVLTPLAGDVPINVTLGTLTVTVSPATATVGIGGTATLTATIVDADGNPVLQPVTWGTLDPRIATVASTGDRTAQITGVGPGATTVVASFGGSAGSSAVVTALPPALQLVMGGFNSPVYVAQPPGDTSRLFVVEQSGRIRLIKNGVLLATPFLDLTSVVLSGGERGLLSVAFHPNYANNGQFFVDYTSKPDGNIQIARYSVSADPDVADPLTALPILAIDHSLASNHNGGLVLFGPDGFLYIGVGDGGGNLSANAQDKTVHLGKILRIDVNAGSPYVVPGGNPFVGLPPAKPEIWTWGMRNPWRFSFDRTTHELYIADVGSAAHEEVDVQPAADPGGENYGWPIMEGAFCLPESASCDRTGLTLPVLDYTHANGCAITGGYVYRGTRLPLLTGHYFYGDYCNGWVKSFRYVNGAVVDQHDYTPEFGIHAEITSFGEDSRGELYIVTQTGNVFKIVPGTP